MRKSPITIRSLLEVSNVWREKEGKNKFIQVTVTVCKRLEYISIVLTQLVVAEAKYSHLIQSRTIEVSKGSKERMEKNRVIQVKDGQTKEE